MLIKVEDLKKGDLILYSNSGRFRIVIVLQDPRLDIDPKTGQQRMLWGTQIPRYKKLRVSCKRIVVDEHQVSRGVTTIYKRVMFEFTAEEHNHKMYIQSNGRDFWLLYRVLSTI